MESVKLACWLELGGWLVGGGSRSLAFRLSPRQKSIAPKRPPPIASNPASAPTSAGVAQSINRRQNPPHPPPHTHTHLLPSQATVVRAQRVLTVNTLDLFATESRTRCHHSEPKLLYPAMPKMYRLTNNKLEQVTLPITARTQKKTCPPRKHTVARCIRVWSC
jgi:hypothetical protein